MLVGYHGNGRHTADTVGGGAAATLLSSLSFRFAGYESNNRTYKDDLRCRRDGGSDYTDRFSGSL